MSTKDTSSYSPSVNSIDKYDNPYSKTVRQHSDDTQYNNNINKKHRNIYGNKQNGNHQTYHSNQYSDNNINNGYYQTHPTRPQPIQSYHGSQNSIHNGHKTHSSPYYSSSQYNIHDGHNRNHNSHHRNNRHQNGLQQMGQSSPNIFINSSTQNNNNNNNNNNIHHTQKTSQDHNIYHNGHRHSNPPKQYQGIIGSNGGKNTPSTSPPTPLKQHIKSTTSNLHSYHHQPSPHHAPNSYHHHHQPQQLQQSMTIPASSGQSPSHSFRQQPQQQHYNINHQQQKSLYNGRPHSAKKHGMQYTFTPSQPQQTQQPQTITLSEKYERNIYEQHGVNVTNVTNGGTGTGTGTGRGRSHTFTPNYSQHEYNQTEEDLIDSYKMANSQQKRNTHSYHQPITPNTISHNQSQQMSLAQIQQIQQQLRMSSSDRRLHQSPQTYHQYQQHHNHNHNHNHNHHPRNGYPSHYRPSPPISPQVIPQQQSIPPHHTQGLNNFALPMSPSMTTNQSQPVHPTGNHNKQKRNHRSRKQHHHMALTKNNTMPQYNPQLPHTQSEQFVGTKHHHHHNHNRNGYGHNGHNYYGHTNNNHNKHYPSTQSTKTTTTTTTNHQHHANSHYQQQQHQHTQSRDKRCQSTPEATPIPSPPARNALSESIAKIDTNASSHNNSFYLIANNEMNTPSSESSSSHPYMADISSHPYLADDEFSARTNNQSQKSRTSGKKKKTGIEPRREKSKKDRNGKSGGHRSRKKKVDKHHQDKKRRKKKKREAIWGHRKQETNKYFTKKSSHRKLLGNKEFVYKKNETTKKFLKKRIQKELLFENLPDSMIRKMVAKMYRVDIPPNECVVKSGDTADAYFVIEKGILQVWAPENTKDKNNKDRDDRKSDDDDNDNDNDNDDESEGNKSPKLKDTLQSGDTFGDNALLYATKHIYTYRAQASPEMNLVGVDIENKSSFLGCRCWALDQETFDSIRKNQASKRLENISKLVKFLKQIPMFKDMMNEDLQEISDAMMRIQYRKNDKIVCEGDSSTHFFIIYRGTCDATKKREEEEDNNNNNNNNNKKNQFGEIILKSYKANDCFGELGIMKSQSRAATIRATSDQVIAYALPALDFKALLDYDVVAKTMNNKINQYEKIPIKYANKVNCDLKEFREIGCLGVGAFGRVTLVENPTDEKVYALKKVRKNRIVETSQQEHILNEKRIMAALDCNFCIKLFATYKDELNVYFLLEPVMGGELFSLLRHEKKLKQRTAIFYCACVVLAFEYLHSKLNVIYRDLKPENLLIANNGYCKLVDFGFAKKRNNTCTLCGTPQYLAPEVIQNLSHGFAVDWWSVGILIYEMIFGFPPFEGDKNMKMYEKILTAPVEFPQQPQIRSYTKDIINSLLRKQAHKRLGAGTKGADTVKKHTFFKRIDWNKMYRMEVSPPWKPRINGNHDLSAFDRFPDTTPHDEKLIPDISGQLFKWCDEF